ncbi:SET domain-containing protein [Thozetella sp. PMI_491]|nr:SET domain-containing protein [Thozetella sp. PMI_491]
MRHTASWSVVLAACCTHLIPVAAHVDSCLKEVPWRDEPTCSAASSRGDLGFQHQNVGSILSKWEGPSNCIGEFCIYVNKDFGGGCVLVSTEENAQAVAEMTAALPALRRESDAFYSTPVEGKGVGLIASRLIKAGEEIMAQAPTLLMQNDAHYYMEDEAQSGLYETAVQMLPAPRRRAFNKLMGHNVRTKVDKNSFRMFLLGNSSEGIHLGSFVEASWFNHDCRPNIQYRIRNLTHSTIAVRDIAPGEELTISYINSMLPLAERRERLSDWGFNCTCQHCLASAAEVAASDARLKRIEALEKKLDDFNDRSVTAETGKELVELYEKERLHIYLGHVYTRAALNFALFGEVERASKYAAVAAEAVEREYGREAGDFHSMRMLVEDPRSHWTWGRRRYL